MANYANFQKVGYSSQATAIAGDWIVQPLEQDGRAALCNDANLFRILIGTFCWGLPNVNNMQVAQLPASGRVLAGFVGRSQQEVWSDASTTLGYSMQIDNTRTVQYYIRGTFATVAPSLNSGGVALAGDIIIQNNNTGALASQTSTTVPSGYTLIPAYTVINPSPVQVANTTASGLQQAGLLIISNVSTY